MATLDYDKDEIEARTVEFVPACWPAGGMSGEGPAAAPPPVPLSRDDVVQSPGWPAWALSDEEVSCSPRNYGPCSTMRPTSPRWT